MNIEMRERLVDSIEAEVTRMYKAGDFVGLELEDVIYIVEGYFWKFGLETDEDEIESIIACASGIHA